LSEDQVASICKKLLFYERYRSTAVKINGKFTFVDLGVDAINIYRDHIETVYVERGEDLVSIFDQICASDFELEGKPMWKLYRIINKDASKPSALLFRLHHSIGDGISLVGTMSKLFETESGEPFSVDIPERMGGGVNGAFSWSSLAKYIQTTFEVLTLPNSRYDSNIAFTSPNKKLLTFTSTRKTIVFPTLKLSFVKDIKNRSGVTINDVLLAATSGAIRRYCARKGDSWVSSSGRRSPADSIQCRALLPVAFPRSRADTDSSTRALRNIWSFASTAMPMKGESSQERLAECAAGTTRLKSSPAALIQLWMQNNVLPLAPDFLRQQLALDLFSRHTMVFSNVPGPAESLRLCGERLLGLHVLFPNLIAQAIIVSYNGGVFFNMSIDNQLVDMCDLLPELFLEEMREMATSFGVDAEDMVLNPYSDM